MLRTHSPLRPSIATRSAFDLHVLSTPPAFILSQDQTLRRELLIYPVHKGPVRVQIKAIHDTGRGSPQVSTLPREKRRPTQAYFWCVSYHISVVKVPQAFTDGRAVCWRPVLPAPERAR